MTRVAFRGLVSPPVGSWFTSASGLLPLISALASACPATPDGLDPGTAPGPTIELAIAHEGPFLPEACEPWWDDAGGAITDGDRLLWWRPGGLSARVDAGVRFRDLPEAVGDADGGEPEVWIAFDHDGNYSPGDTSSYLRAEWCDLGDGVSQSALEGFWVAGPPHVDPLPIAWGTPFHASVWLQDEEGPWDEPRLDVDLVGCSLLDNPDCVLPSWEPLR